MTDKPITSESDSWEKRMHRQLLRERNAITPELLMQRTEWPMEDAKIEAKPNMGIQLLGARKKMCRFAVMIEEKIKIDPDYLLTDKEANAQSSIVRKFERIYEKADKAEPGKRYRRAANNIELIDKALQELHAEGYHIADSRARDN